jgi:hypothetical protein
MSVVSRYLLLAAALLVGANAKATDVSPPESAQPVREFDKVRVGMTATDAAKHMGRPDRVSRQVFYKQKIEQWFFHDPVPTWVTLSGVRGQDPRVISIHPSKNR